MTTPKDNLMAVLSGDSPSWMPACVHIANTNNLPGHLPCELITEPLDRLQISEFVGGDIVYEVSGVKRKLPNAYSIETEDYDSTRYSTLSTPADSLSEDVRICYVESPDFGDLPQAHAKPGPIVNTVHSNFFVRKPEDYRILRDYFDAMTFEADPSAVSREIARVGEKGIVVLGGGPSSPLYSLVSSYAGLEQVTFDLFDATDEVASTMRTMQNAGCRWYEAAVKTPCEVIRCTEDLDTNLVSPEWFGEYSVPALKEYAEICHSHGKLFVIHMCGPIRDFFPHLAEVGADAIHCLTTPDAMGNTSVSDAREALSGRTAAMFRVPAEALLRGNKGILDKFIDRLLEGIGDWRNVMVIIPCGRANPGVIRHVIEHVHKQGRWGWSAEQSHATDG